MTNSAIERYSEAHFKSIEDPNSFWLTAAKGIDWITEPTEALEAADAPFYKWFPDGELNTSVNCLDRHVAAGRGGQAAIIYDSAMTGSKDTITYAQLLREVEEFAGVLAANGVGKGDRVVIYMPMIPRAAVAMLACARLGAVHSVVFGGFAPAELAIRIDDARPKVVVTAAGGIEPTRRIHYFPIVEKALQLAQHSPLAVIATQRPDIFPDESLPEMANICWSDWDCAVIDVEPHGPVTVNSNDPLYILYTSGTTGLPKGVVRDNGGHAVALNWSMSNIFGIRPGEVWWTASDVGWVVGHSYIVYAPLLAGATSLIYEGKPVGTPNAGAFWRVASEYRVSALFTAPTAVRAIRKEDPDGEFIEKYDLTSIRTFFCAGERLDPETYHWLTENLDKPVVDNWWQTETGWPIASNMRGLAPTELKPGSPSLPVPGYDLKVLDALGNEAPVGTEGNLAIKLPMAPGSLIGLWEDDNRFASSYLETFNGYYATGDGGYIDEDGYVFVMGRTDDVINVAGHRLSTGSMEAVIAKHSAVAEAAVIGVHDTLKGQRPVGYVVLKSGQVYDPEQIRVDLVEMVRNEIGAVATFRDCFMVEGLPKTRSGKILRKTMRQIADGQIDVSIPSTIEDAEVLHNLTPTLREHASDAKPPGA